MADEQSTPEENTTNRKSIMGKLLIAAAMGGVVALECLLAYVLIPSADEVAALAEQKMTNRLPSNLISGEQPSQGQTSKPTAEIDLGEYSVTVSQPSSSVSLRVDFHLVGIVLEEEHSEMQAIYDRTIHRFRDQILFEIRNSEPADLADPGLGLIKRRILEKSNELFGKSILRSVVFSQFSFIEQ